MSEGRAVDVQMLDRLREETGDDDGSLIAELLDFFFEDTPIALETIATHYAQGDAAAVGAAAHKLKSSTANLGVVSMTALAQEIERLGRGGELDGVQERIAALQVQFQKADEELRAYLASVA